MPPRTPIGRLATRLALAASCLAAGALAAAPPPPEPMAPGLSPSARLAALIERVKSAQKNLKSLEADFVQRKQSEFLAAPEESRGSFQYLSPDRVRWEYAEPRPITLVLHDDEMLTWYRDLGRAERLHVGRVSAQVFRYLNASGSLESLMGYFSVSFTLPSGEEPFRLELKPLYARIAKRLAGMTLWIDRRLYLPVRVQYAEPNGDSTEYRFDKLRPNVAIPKDRFELQLPDGVEIKVVDLDGRSAPQ
jgi:outer membrane lipoprotein carrier protein